MFTTLKDVRGVVGKQYSDEYINMLISSTKNEITNEIGEIEYSLREQVFDVCGQSRTLQFDTVQVHKILSVDGVTYTGEYDILPPQNRSVFVHDLFDYVEYGPKKETFTVKYISGYQDIPKDIVLAHTLIVADVLSSGNSAISKYKMGPRTVEYNQNAGNNYSKQVERILSRYRPLITV